MQPVRFGFKTSPQYTSWQDMRQLWIAADALEVFE
jgi:hypothetical protein